MVQIPGRENGGNCDIKNLSRGCKVYFPVFVDGANLSVGDMHFSQVKTGHQGLQSPGVARGVMHISPLNKICWKVTCHIYP